MRSATACHGTGPCGRHGGVSGEVRANTARHTGSEGEVIEAALVRTERWLRVPSWT